MSIPTDKKTIKLITDKLLSTTTLLSVFSSSGLLSSVQEANNAFRRFGDVAAKAVPSLAEGDVLPPPFRLDVTDVLTPPTPAIGGVAVTKSVPESADFDKRLLEF